MPPATLYNNVFHAPITSPIRSAKSAVRHEIIEISSDEDMEIDDGQPESSKRPRCQASNPKRAVSIHSDDEHDDYHDESEAGINPYYHLLNPTSMKRQKRNHLNNLAHFDFDPFPTEYTDLFETTPILPPEGFQSQDYPKVTLTFNTDGEGDSLATLAFRPSVGRQITPPVSQPNPSKQTTIDVLDPIADAKTDKTKLKSCPYYDDPIFEARMYCGPGYEKYPVVLNSVPEHQKVCDEWDMIRARQSIRRQSRKAGRNELSQYINGPLNNDSSDEGDDEDDILAVEATKLDLLHQIREVLPDIQRAFVIEKIQNYLDAGYLNIDDDIQVQPNSADILAAILETPDYPREEKGMKPALPAPDGTGVTVTYRKAGTGGKLYQRDAVCLIASQFDHVPTHFINRTVLEKQSLFGSYLHIHELEANYSTLSSSERSYRRSVNPRVTLEKKYTAKGNDLRFKDQWENAVNELQAAKQQAERVRIRQDREVEERTIEEINLQEHKACGKLIECQCCFEDEVPTNRAVSCEGTEMHRFCFACVRALAENQIGSMKHDMKCMHGSGCDAHLSKGGIDESVPAKVVEKLAFYQQQFEISAACIDGLEQCPFCDFKAICDPIEESTVFQCHNPDCKRVSCRKCHEDSHLPKSCDEVKQDNQISARHQVEEARSEAMMRACPKCKVKIIKEIGCNKMRCTRCGCVMCYVCKTDISARRDGGYGHFNDNGAKCILYDKDFDRHEAEADAAEKEAIKRVQAENMGIKEELLQIETGPKDKDKGKTKLPNGEELGFGFGRLADGAVEPPGMLGFDEIMRRQRQRFYEITRVLNQDWLPQAARPPTARNEPARARPFGLQQAVMADQNRAEELRTEVRALQQHIDQARVPPTGPVALQPLPAPQYPEILNNMPTPPLLRPTQNHGGGQQARKSTAFTRRVAPTLSQRAALHPNVHHHHWHNHVHQNAMNHAYNGRYNQGQQQPHAIFGHSGFLGNKVHGRRNNDDLAGLNQTQTLQGFQGQPNLPRDQEPYGDQTAFMENLFADWDTPDINLLPPAPPFGGEQRAMDVDAWDPFEDPLTRANINMQQNHFEQPKADPGTNVQANTELFF